MQCNLDARGKAVRLKIGAVLVVVGALLAIFWALPSRTPLAIGTSVVVLIAGGFAIFEGWAGWCAVRASGLKTRW